MQGLEVIGCCISRRPAFGTIDNGIRLTLTLYVTRFALGLELPPRRNGIPGNGWLIRFGDFGQGGDGSDILRRFRSDLLRCDRDPGRFRQ